MSRAGHFCRDVALNPNKSNLTVATPRTRVKKKEKKTEHDEDRSRERYRDRNRRIGWNERGGEEGRGQGIEIEKRRIIKRVSARCRFGIRRRPKAVRVIRERERRDKWHVCLVLNAHRRPLAAARLFAVGSRLLRSNAEPPPLASTATTCYRSTVRIWFATDPWGCFDVRLTSDCPFDFRDPSSVLPFLSFFFPLAVFCRLWPPPTLSSIYMHSTSGTPTAIARVFADSSSRLPFPRKQIVSRDRCDLCQNFLELDPSCGLRERKPLLCEVTAALVGIKIHASSLEWHVTNTSKLLCKNSPKQFSKLYLILFDYVSIIIGILSAIEICSITRHRTSLVARDNQPTFRKRRPASACP